MPATRTRTRPNPADRAQIAAAGLKVEVVKFNHGRRNRDGRWQVIWVFRDEQGREIGHYVPFSGCYRIRGRLCGRAGSVADVVRAMAGEEKVK